MRRFAPLLAGFLLAHATATGDVRPVAKASSAPTVVAGGQSVLADVQSQYSQMEANLEMMFAKLMKEAKGNKDAIEDQIKNIGQQIEKLKQMMKRLELVLQKLEDLLPKIMGLVGSDSHPGRGPTPSPGPRDQLAALLAAELAKAGVPMSPTKIQEIADAIAKGGQAGMAVAMQIMLSIAEADAGKSLSQPVSARALVGSGLRAIPAATPSAAVQSLLAAPIVPQITPADLSAASSLPASARMAYFGQRFNGWAAERRAAINKEISSLELQKKTLYGQIAALDKQIEKLQQDKAKALAELAKQKQKALEEATKALQQGGKIPTPALVKP